MKGLLSSVVKLLTGGGSSRAQVPQALDYGRMIMLDAEDLAEAGICEAYERIKPALREYVASPAEILETIDDETSLYRVRAAGRTYDIYGPRLPGGAGQSWGRATVALFDIVNGQLASRPVKFYAISGGNDLGGLFLTPEMLETAKRSLKQKTDWPYLPVLDHPWYGQSH